MEKITKLLQYAVEAVDYRADDRQSDLTASEIIHESTTVAQDAADDCIISQKEVSTVATIIAAEICRKNGIA